MNLKNIVSGLIIGATLLSSSPVHADVPRKDPFLEYQRKVDLEFDRHSREMDRLFNQFERDLDILYEQQEKEHERKIKQHMGSLDLDNRVEMQRKYPFERLRNLDRQLRELENELSRPSPFRERREFVPQPKPLPDPLETLAKKINPTKAQFNELRGMIKTTRDYVKLLHHRDIKYSKQGSQEFRRDERRDHGAPINTHKNGSGVCDELALYFASFFAGKPGYEVHLVEFRDQTRKMRPHSTIVYQGPSNRFGFASNTRVFKEIYETKEEAMVAALVDSGYDPDRTTTLAREIKRPGKWMYNNRASKRLRPTKKIDLEPGC